MKVLGGGCRVAEGVLSPGPFTGLCPPKADVAAVCDRPPAPPVPPLRPCPKP